MKTSSAFPKWLIFYLLTIFSGIIFFFFQDLNLADINSGPFKFDMLLESLGGLLFLSFFLIIFCSPLLIVVIPYFIFTARSSLSQAVKIMLTSVFGLAISLLWAFLLSGRDGIDHDLLPFVIAATLSGFLVELSFKLKIKEQENS